jgi:hypothetical protein
MLNIEGIHCKVSYDGQIRRFSFVGTEFTSLKELIARLAKIQGEFVLKYRDDESDYVTLQNQEDLTTALMISPTLLRIAVETTTVPLSCPSTTLENRKRPYNHYQHHRDTHRRDTHRDHHHKSVESRRWRVEKKLVFINQCLIDLGTDDSKLTPRDLFKKKKLEKKQQRLETFFNHEGKCHKREKRVLSPEEEQFNCAIKLQMLEIKTEVVKVKARKREIKLMLQDRPGDKALGDELNSLKEQKQLFSAQRKSLCDLLHS